MSECIIAPGTRITNTFNKETFVFTHPYDHLKTGQMDVILEQGGSGGGNAIAHLHPNTDEIFLVQSGCLAVTIEGVEHVVGPGGSVIVPKGARHFFRNAYDGETRITVTFSNAQQHHRFFLNLAMWTRDHPGYFSSRGDVKLLAIALFLHAYRGHLYIAGPPVWLQKILFASITPLSLLRGYRLAVKPAG